MLNLIQHKHRDSIVYGFVQKKRLEGNYAPKAMIAEFNKFLRVYYNAVSAHCKDTV